LKYFKKLLWVIKLFVLFVFIGCKQEPTGPENSVPNIPNIPSNLSNGYVDSTYSFSTSTTDPDGDNVSYQFDWRDGNLSPWSNYVSSGTSVNMSHSWSKEGTYNVKVKAQDEDGAESGWSGGLSFEISHLLTLVKIYDLAWLDITGYLSIAAKSIYVYASGGFSKILRLDPTEHIDTLKTVTFTYSSSNSLSIREIFIKEDTFYIVAGIYGDNLKLHKISLNESDKTFEITNSYTLPTGSYSNSAGGMCYAEGSFYSVQWNQEDVVKMCFNESNNLIIDEVFKNTGLTEPFGITFDGQCFWTCNNYWRIHNHNPNNFSINFSCNIDTVAEPEDITFDGTYLWTINDDSFHDPQLVKWKINY